MTNLRVKPQTPDLPQTHPGHDAAWASYWQEKSRWQDQEIERLRQELWVIATAIWENISRDEVKHWAQGIRVSIAGASTEPPKFTVTAA